MKPPRELPAPISPCAEPTAAAGKMSMGSVVEFVIQIMWAKAKAAAAASGSACPGRCGVRKLRATTQAAPDITVRRAGTGAKPERIRRPDSHPPRRQPRSAATKTTQMVRPSSARVRPRTSWRYLGNQKRKKYQIGRAHV